VPAKLVVSSNKKKQLVLELESAAGKTLLSAGPFTDKRSVAGLRRTLNSVLSETVGYEDRTAKAAEKAATAPVVKRTSKVAAAAKPVNAVEAPIVKAPKAAPATKARRPRKAAVK
jgi:hypothetical protein